ncbi:hypothetical protein TI04_11570 [Achromatium sp. WMS2]|nr:hypothetical protein TI04_11570 [Achromatium sp. WMS2]
MGNMLSFVSSAPTYLRVLWVVWVIAGFILVFATVDTQARKLGHPSGKIEFPTNGSSVSPTFEVRGVVMNLGKEDSLWLAVRKDQSIWPKAPKIVPIGNKWSATISEGGTRSGSSFSLMLLLANKKVSTKLQEYVNGNDFSAQSIEDYQGINLLHEITLQIK